MKRICLRAAVFSALFLFFPFASLRACSNGKVVSETKNISFAVPRGWTCAVKSKGTFVLSAPFNKTKLLNPSITFSHKKIKDAPDSPPPEDVWGETIGRLIKEVDPKAEILYKKSVMAGGMPAYVSAAYVKYVKMHNHKKYSVRTFQKACSLWSGKDKTMYSLILVTLDKDKLQYEKVFNKLIKGLKTK